MSKLPNLQLAIMQCLWRRSHATVAEVQADLEVDRPLAYTTIATMLSKMEAKGLVAHKRQGRTFIYRPLAKQEQVSRSMVADLAERVFGGDITQMVSHLLDECDVQPEELARLKAMIDEAEKNRGR
jgi:BlaI family penicillinase repressor